MDFLKVLAPTLWCNCLFGFSQCIVNSNGVRQSRLLKIHRYLFCSVSAFLQLAWYAQHLYFKYTTDAIKLFQENLLLFCVCCNIAVSLLPCKNLLSNDSVFYCLLVRIHKYEREIFTTRRGKLRKMLVMNIILLTAGFMVPITFITLEAFKTWTSYSIGKHHILTDITGISSGFLRPVMNVVFLDNYFMYMLIFGTAYANINESLSRHTSRRRKRNSYFLLKYLKVLEDLDNVLKDFHREVMVTHSGFCILMVVLALCNWFYVVGFIFLNLSPRFMTYYGWMVFFTVIFGFIICGSVYAHQQVERTPGLLHKLYAEIDDPRIMEEVEILSLQLLHREVEFDAGGFFKLDFSLILSMIGTVTTYVLILIQFESPGAANCHRNQTILTNLNNTGF